MNEQEAISWFRSKLAVNASLGLVGAQNETAEIAVSAIKKQVPMKPETFIAQERTEVRHHVFFGPGTTLYTCPVCGSFTTPTQMHCSECGQKFDWSEFGKGGLR